MLGPLSAVSHLVSGHTDTGLLNLVASIDSLDLPEVLFVRI